MTIAAGSLPASSDHYRGGVDAAGVGEVPSVPSVREIDARLTAPGEGFEIETVSVAGRPTRIWKHAPRTLREVVHHSLEVGGDGVFIICGEERWTHAAHHAAVLGLAAALIDDHGVQPGDRVAVAMRNVPEWSIAFFAAAYAGAIAVPLNAFWNGVELDFALADCGAKVLIADGERLERLGASAPSLGGLGSVIGVRLSDRKTDGPLPDGVLSLAEVLARVGARGAGREPDRTWPPLEPDDPATLFYTSGTTNHPKGVLGTHRNICQNLVSLRYTGARAMARMGMTPAVDAASAPPARRAVTLVPVPMFHATGCHSNLVNQAWSGGTVVFMRKWDPAAAIDLIEAERVTNVSGVPAMAWDIVNHPGVGERDLSSLWSLGGGGSAAPPELLRRIHEVLPNVASGTGYGLTESSSLTASIGGADYDERPSSVGVPVPIVDVAIVDAHGEPVVPGAVGEVWIKGPTVVPGYWQRPEATAATFTDGWLHSGDLGRLDEDGFLYIVDRAKDMVIRGGENISSIEVEDALFSHPDVLEVGVFSVPHPVLGEEVGAAVHLRPGSAATPDGLRAHAATLLAPYKVPAHIWLVPEPLPRGATGKLLKRELKATFAPS